MARLEEDPPFLGMKDGARKALRRARGRAMGASGSLGKKSQAEDFGGKNVTEFYD
jgi:hypothetical protein